jgi:hypothetical protein
MKAARPLDDIIKPSIPLAFAHSGSPLKQARSGHPDGPMVSRAPVPPQYPATFTIQSTRATPSSAQPVPQSTYATEHPTVGRIFATISQGVGVQCSGVLLVSKNHSVIDTAAHCLYDPNKQTWFQNLMFCPQYFNGCPGDMWYARYAAMDTGWMSSHNSEQDFGDFSVAPNLDGISIGSFIGGSGYLYDGPHYTSEDAYGYPHNLSNGEIMYTCSGSGAPVPGSRTPAPSPLLSGIPCDMGEGSSGGPWFTHYNGGVFVNGHSDAGTIIPTTNGQSISIMVSPYYNDEWYNIYNLVQEH